MATLRRQNLEKVYTPRESACAETTDSTITCSALYEPALWEHVRVFLSADWLCLLNEYDPPGTGCREGRGNPGVAGGTPRDRQSGDDTSRDTRLQGKSRETLVGIDADHFCSHAHRRNRR